MVVLGGLLIGGTVGLGRILQTIRGAANMGVAHRATYCAEAGLSAGRDYFRARRPS